MRGSAPSFYSPAKMHHPGIPLEIGALCRDSNGLVVGCRACVLASLCGAGSTQQKVDVSRQPYCSLFGAVFHANSLALAIRKNEFHRLAGLRYSCRAVKGHASRLHMDFLRGCIVFFFCPRCILGALQVELYFTVANDILAVSLVFTAVGVYDVVPVASFSKNGDLDVFQKARRIVLEVRRL